MAFPQFSFLFVGCGSYPTLPMSAPKDSLDSTSLPVLELDLQYEPVLTKEVKQSRTVTFSRQQKMSVYGKRILARVMEQITEDDLQLRDVYQFRVASIVTDTPLDVAGAYVHIKPALRELSRTSWEFEDAASLEWNAYPLLSAIGMKAGIVSISLNPRLTPFFIKIAGQYSTYKLDAYMGLNSWYAMRFYEILSTFRDTGWWEVSLDDYRMYMDCGPELDKAGKPKKDKTGHLVMKLPGSTDLIKNTVIHSQTELADTPCAFSYRPLYEQDRTSRGRPKIVGLRFELLHKQLTVIPASWLNDREISPVINSLRGFKITDKNIALYLQTLTIPGARKLLREWQLKENSQQKIDDKVKYCNAVLVRVAKQMMADAKAEVLQARSDVKQALLGFMT